MKNIFCIILLFPICFFAQIKSGTITYGISYEFEDDLKKGLMSGYVEKAIQNAKYYSFNLDFNQEAMVFYALDNMPADGQKNSFVLEFCSGDGLYYKEKNFTETFHEFYSEDFGVLILQSEDKLVWELTNETKMINNFLCYRANTNQTVTNDNGVFKFPIIAWYCPEIPFPYGPKEYGGLPGLILELQERNALFGVQKIDLSATENKTILKPSKGKIITELEFSKMIDDYTKKMKEEK